MSSAGHIWTVHSLLPAGRCVPAHVLQGLIVLNMAGHPPIDKDTENSKPAAIVRCYDAPPPSTHCESNAVSLFFPPPPTP